MPLSGSRALTWLLSEHEAVAPRAFLAPGIENAVSTMTNVSARNYSVISTNVSWCHPQILYICDTFQLTKITRLDTLYFLCAWIFFISWGLLFCSFVQVQSLIFMGSSIYLRSLHQDLRHFYSSYSVPLLQLPFV